MCGPSRWAINGVLADCFVNEALLRFAYQKVSGQLSFSKTKNRMIIDVAVHRRTKKTNFWLDSKLLDTESTILPI